MSIIDTPSPDSGACKQALLHRFKANTQFCFVFITNRPRAFENLELDDYIVIPSDKFTINLKQIIGVITQKHPEVIESHSYKPHLIVACSKLLLAQRFRWYFIEHGYTAGIKLRLLNACAFLAAAFADRVYSPNVALVRKFASINRDVQFLPSAPVGDLPAEETQANFSDRLKVAFVGRLSREKNPMMLLRAARILAHVLPNRFEIVLAGEGPLKSLLERYIAANGLSSVKLLGQIAINQLSPDVLVICSDSEGFPNTLFEFAAVIVTTPVGSIPEVLASKPHLAITVGDHVTLAEKLIQIANEPERFADYRQTTRLIRKQFTLQNKLSCLHYDQN